MSFDNYTDADYYLQFENYIEFGKFLEELLYNFSFNWKNSAELFEYSEQYAVTTNKSLVSLTKFVDTKWGSLVKMFGENPFDFPERRLHTIIYLQKRTRVFLDISISPLPLNPTWFYSKNEIPKSSLYDLRNSYAEKINEFRLEFDFLQFYDYTENLYFYQIDKNLIINRDLLAGLGMKYSRDIFNMYDARDMFML